MSNSAPTAIVPELSEVRQRFISTLDSSFMGDTELQRRRIGFDAFIEEHERQHGGKVMCACAEYLSRLGYDEASTVLLAKCRDEEAREAAKKK